MIQPARASGLMLGELCPRRATAVLAALIAAGPGGCSRGPGSEVDVVGPPLQVGPGLVIAQVYGGGGNASAPFGNDFVEIFNRGASALALDGLSVQYASATGAGTFRSGPVVALSGSLAPGQHHLLALAGGATGAALPAADARGSINMSASAGKVALVRGTAGLDCNGGSSSPCTAEQEASIIDLVGYGGANYFEGAPAPALGNTTAAVRKNGGCTDTNHNDADLLAEAPHPRNSASPIAACGGDAPPVVVRSVPAAGATAVAGDTTITVDFSEPVRTGGGWFSLSCAASGPVSAGVSGGPASFVLDPDRDLASGERCTVTILAAGVSDLAGQAMAADHTFSFTIAAPAGLVRISAIQGPGHLSPLAGVTVTTRGIVTAVRSNGFYLQDPAPDDDLATSEAIFVFTGSAPTVAVGDDLTATGPVAEFRPGCTPGCAPGDSAFASLTTTEIDHPALSRHAAGVPLPAPTLIGLGGRMPPPAVIDDDTGGNVENGGAFDPASDGIDFYESLEAMRVQVNDAVAVGPTRDFGGDAAELVVVGDGGAHAGLRTARGGVAVAPGDFNPERIFLGNTIVPTLPAADVGDAFPGAIVGVLDYSFGNFKLLVTAPLPAPRPGGLTRESVSLPAPGPSDLRVAAFNVENLDPGDPPSKFAALAGIIVNNLGAPDLLALEEVQDDDGPTSSGVVTATATAGALVAAIRAAGGPGYQWRSIDPVNGQDGGQPGGNIRVGFLFRADRGLSFVDRPGAGSLTANAVVSSGGAPALAYSPGRIDPTNPAFSNSRKPLAAELTFRGQTFFVIANHFNSKGGDQPLFGRFQPPTLSSETQRRAQASVLASFVGALLAASAGANVIVLGDLNDFEFSAPVRALKDAGLADLIERLPPDERYTYVFEGNSQTLDHLLVSAHAGAQVTGFDVVHVNAEFRTQASDHDPGVASFSLHTGELFTEAPAPLTCRIEPGP